MLGAGSADLPLPMNALIKSCSGWKVIMIREHTKANMLPERRIRSVISRPGRIGTNGKQKLLKANHLSQRYALEDQIIKEFPQKIRSLEQRIEGYQTDIDQRKRNTEPNEDGFSPMFMPGGTVREKKAAGDAILGLCKSMTSPEPISIGQYRGFDMELSFDTFSREYKITLIHQLRHTVTLGTDIFGNIQRLDNTLAAFEERMAACAEQLENTRVQLENAKAEVQKPFSQEEELKAKSERLNELNAMLNLDKRENEIVDGERADEEPSRSSDDRER